MTQRFTPRLVDKDANDDARFEAIAETLESACEAHLSLLNTVGYMTAMVVEQNRRIVRLERWLAAAIAGMVAGFLFVVLS